VSIGSSLLRPGADGAEMAKSWLRLARGDLVEPSSMNPLVHRREFILGTSMLIAGFAVRPQGARGEAQLNTMKLPEKPDYLAPDGSEIRLLVATPRGSMAHCQLPPNAVTKPVWHRSVEEMVLRTWPRPTVAAVRFDRVRD
jgi:hypothetical protein